MKNKTKILILCVIAFTLGILVYINPLFIYRNYKLINHIESISHKETITKEDLIPFDYDKLYVVYPYTSKKDIEKDLKIKSRYIKENDNDRYQNLLVIKDNKVISSTKISFKYSFQPLAEYNHFNNSKNSIIKIYNFEDTTSFIEEKKYYEETFNDIAFTLPGSYYKEDNEDIRMYYLSLDTGEYLTISKEDNFNLKKYKKNKNIISTKEETINNNKTIYLEITKDNTIDLVYIINQKYIFTLNTTKENIVKNKENLYNIIKSIKE